MNSPHPGISHDMQNVGGAPAVSVVMPCRNEREHIEESVRSVLDQRGVEGGFEVLVVDGQSDDGTREILDRLAQERPTLRVLDNPRRITSFAMNLGIEQARGACVAILGAHTLYPYDYLATCQSLLAEHPESDCVGGTLESRGHTHFGRAVAFAMSHPAGVGNALHRYPHYEGYAEGACFPVFRREALFGTGLYDTELVRNQDDDLNYRYRRAGGRVYISHRARCVYFVRETALALFRQYFQYGAWRVRVLRKHGQVASWRQLAPVVFFAWTLSAGVLSPWLSGAALLVLWAPGIAYVVLLLAAMVLSLPSVGFAAALRVPAALLIMHCAYAFGFARSVAFGPSR